MDATTTLLLCLLGILLMVLAGRIRSSSRRARPGRERTRF